MLCAETASPPESSGGLVFASGFGIAKGNGAVLALEIRDPMADYLFQLAIFSAAFIFRNIAELIQQFSRNPQREPA